MHEVFAQNILTCGDAGGCIGKSTVQVHQLLTSKKLGAPSEKYARIFKKLVNKMTSDYPKNKISGRAYMTDKSHVVYTIFRDGKCSVMQSIYYKAATNSTISEGDGAGQLLTELRNGKYTLVKKKDYESDDLYTFTNGSINFSVGMLSDNESYFLLVVTEK